MLVRILSRKAEYKIVYTNDSNLKSLIYLHIHIRNILGKNVLKGDSLWVGRLQVIYSFLFL